MAATISKGRAIAGIIRKKLTKHIRAANPLDSSPLSLFWKASHSTCNYDKDVEQVHPAMVPDLVIGEAQPGKYWGPHPATGVFGPTDFNAGDLGQPTSQESANGGPSALDQTVRFRQLELEDSDN